MKTQCKNNKIIQFRAGVEHFSFILERFGISRETLDLLISDELVGKKSGPIKDMQEAVFKLCNAIAMELNKDGLIEEMLKTHRESSSNCIRFTSVLLELRRLLGPKMFLHFLHQHRQKQGQIGSGNGKKEEEEEVADAGPSMEVIMPVPKDPVNPESAVNIYEPVSSRELVQSGVGTTALALSFQNRGQSDRIRGEITRSMRKDLQEIGSAEEIKKSMQIVEKLQSDKLAKIEANPQLVEDFITELTELSVEGSELNIFFKQEMEKIRDLLKAKFKVKQASSRVTDRIKQAESARRSMLMWTGLETIATLSSCAGAYLYYLYEGKPEDCSSKEGWGSSLGCYTAKGAGLLNPVSWGKAGIRGTVGYVAPAFIGMTVYRQLQVYLSSQKESLKMTQKMKSNLEEVIRVYDGIIDDNIGALEEELLAQINSIQTTNRELVPLLMGYLQGSGKDSIKQKAKSYIKNAINRIRLHYSSAELILPPEDATRLSSALSSLNASLNDEKTGAILDKLQQDLTKYSLKQQMSDAKVTTRSAAKKVTEVAFSLGKKAAKTAALTYGGPAGAAAIGAVSAATAGQGKRRTRKNSNKKPKTKKAKKAKKGGNVVSKRK